MAKKIMYAGVGNVAKLLRGGYVGINGTAQIIERGYAGVGGKAVQFWPPLPCIEQWTQGSTGITARTSTDCLIDQAYVVSIDYYRSGASTSSYYYESFDCGTSRNIIITYSATAPAKPYYLRFGYTNVDDDFVQSTQITVSGALSKRTYSYTVPLNNDGYSTWATWGFALAPTTNYSAQTAINGKLTIHTVSVNGTVYGFY